MTDMPLHPIQTHCSDEELYELPPAAHEPPPQEKKITSIVLKYDDGTESEQATT